MVEGTAEDLAWLAGHWRGEAFGGVGEEIWSDSQGGALMGVYRLLQEGAVAFYEILTIAEAEEGLVMRLRHFNPDLTGWEEKDAPLVWPLVRLGDRTATFGGITYRRTDEDTLRISLQVEKRDGTRREEVHTYRRVPPDEVAH